MGKVVDFKFDVHAEVKTPLGKVGIIKVLAFDKGGISYYLGTDTHDTWYLESRLTEHKTE